MLPYLFGIMLSEDWEEWVVVGAALESLEALVEIYGLFQSSQIEYDVTFDFLSNLINNSALSAAASCISCTFSIPSWNRDESAPICVNGIL